MDTLINDIRVALRSLWRAPAFTIAAVLTLAVGIGANTAIFSVVDGVLLRPVPFEGIDRLMMVWQTDRGSGTTHEPASIPDFLDFQRQSRSFSSFAAITASELNLTRRDADPRRVPTLSVTPEFFRMTGAKLLAGRFFSNEENVANGPRSVLISETLARDVFNSTEAAVGKTVLLNDVEWNVVGVVPTNSDFGVLQILNSSAYGRGFAQRGGRPRVDVWTALRPAADASRDNHPIIVLGQLATGATQSSAQAEMTRIAAELERTYASSNVNRGVNVQALESVVFGAVRPTLFVLLGSVALVLLVACGNVANLLLVRGSHRMREISVRAALGASGARLLRQFLVESMLLSTAGVVAGLLIAQFGLQALLSLAPSTLPRIETVGINGRVLMLALGLSVAIAIAFSCVPVFQSRRRDLQSTLRGSTHNNSGNRWFKANMRSILVVSEVAIAVTLVVGAGLMVKSLWHLQGVNPGFTASNVLKAEFELPAARYPQDRRVFPNWPASKRFISEVQTRLAAEPGVQSVAVAVANPLDVGFTSSIRVVGREPVGNWPEPSIRMVSRSYFETLGVPLVSGRGFDATDNETSAPVIVINESARRIFFDGRDPVNQTISMWGANRRVVGVIANERIKGLTEAAPPALYMSTDQNPMASSVLVKTSGDPAQFAATLRRVIREVDPALPLYGVEPLTQTLNGTFAERRFAMLLLVVFASAAMLLAMIGVHGVLSYAVSQRTREIGIRIALGAEASGVQRLIVAEGAKLAVIGLAIGLISAFGLTQLLSTLLFGVGARDPFTFVAASAILGIVAVLSAWLPANRASRINPLTAIRSE